MTEIKEMAEQGKNEVKPLTLEKNLEDWLMECTDDDFPTYDKDNGENPYPKRYIEFKKALLPIHNNVKQGAMAKGASEWMEGTIKIIEEIEDAEERNRLLAELKRSDPIVHLNNHGKGHVDKVIDKVSEMLHFFDRGHLTPYERFFLLCAIQVHDIGNVFGRSEHEKHCFRILQEKGKPYIPDKFERQLIQKLALVHGGACDGDQDTIKYLLDAPKDLYGKKIRKRLLAALLRFGDELADDSSRADREGLEMDTILEGSRIYHQYSAALHTVAIERNPINHRGELCLCYDFDSNIATKLFRKNNQDKYLLDEIYDRTLKMERERRYCMRYIRSCFSLDCIKVKIIIQNANESWKIDKIEYTLMENGYPVEPDSDCIRQYEPDIRTGQEEIEYLKQEWGLDT